MEERLQKFMARCGVASRRKCEELIADGLVEINGDEANPLFLFANPNVFPVSVTATEHSELLFIEKNVFLELLQKNKSLLENFLSMMSDRGKFLSEKIGFLAFKTIKNKLADFILQKAREQKQTSIVLTETQQELAYYFGVARPSLARCLKLLEEEGAILSFPKNIIIRDLEMLKKMV